MEQLSNRRHPVIGPGRQRGVVLFVALVVLVLVTSAGLSVIRAMDTGNSISGNYAFQQSTLAASDLAITNAANILASTVAASATSGNSSIANRYSSVIMTPVDAKGIPGGINWAGMSCMNEKGVAVGCSDDKEYRIQYFIERQCASNPANLTSAAAIRVACQYEIQVNPSTGAQVTVVNAATGEVSPMPAVLYRVMIRARGPRNTESFYEVMISGPASPKVGA